MSVEENSYDQDRFADFFALSVIDWGKMKNGGREKRAEEDEGAIVVVFIVIVGRRWSFGRAGYNGCRFPNMGTTRYIPKKRGILASTRRGLRRNGCALKRAQ